MGDIIGGIGSFISGIAEDIISLLPDSPFQSIVDVVEVSELLGMINWVIPFGFAVSMLQLWLVAVAGFYVWQFLLRYISAIE